MNTFTTDSALIRASIEAEEYRNLLLAFWQRGEDFPWQEYYPSFDEFLREAKQFADTP